MSPEESELNHFHLVSAFVHRTEHDKKIFCIYVLHLYSVFFTSLMYLGTLKRFDNACDPDIVTGYKDTNKVISKDVGL